MAIREQFILKAEAGTWTLFRDEHKIGTYSHLDRATHEAVRLARELQETGEPAQVLVHAADGKVVEIDVDPEVTQEEERRGPEARDL